MISDKLYITCTAIWYLDLPTQAHLPKNITKGVVVCGHRHGNCIATTKALSNLRTVHFAIDGVGESIQGFLTSAGNFVNRLEAMEIALNSGQVTENQLGNKLIGLFSEDIY